MSVELKEAPEARLLEVTASGKLQKSDYELFAPRVETLIREWGGKIRVLLVLRDFHGWTAGALWEDVKFDLKHFNDIERLAIVGEKSWHKGMAVFCKPFTTAKVRFFPTDRILEARSWIEEGATQPTGRHVS